MESTYHIKFVTLFKAFNLCKNLLSTDRPTDIAMYRAAIAARNICEENGLPLRMSLSKKTKLKIKKSEFFN